MVIFHSYVKLPEGTHNIHMPFWVATRPFSMALQSSAFCTTATTMSSSSRRVTVLSFKSHGWHLSCWAQTTDAYRALYVCKNHRVFQKMNTTSYNHGDYPSYSIISPWCITAVLAVVSKVITGDPMVGSSRAQPCTTPGPTGTHVPRVELTHKECWAKINPNEPSNPRNYGLIQECWAKINPMAFH